MGLFDKTDAGKSLRFFTVTILFEILIILCYGFTAVRAPPGQTRNVAATSPR